MDTARSPTSPRKPLALPSTHKPIGLAELEAPLDYSFYNMTSLQDVIYWEPRQGFLPPKRLYVEEEVSDNEARVGAKAANPILPKKSTNQKLSKSKCLKLNNNCLSEIGDIKEVASGLFEDVDSVAWLDLSFNELTKVDDILLQFPNLQILYLHGNQFSNMAEIEKLAKIPTLKKLSLHGNPIENEKGYKYIVMSMLPGIQTLDFSRITKADRRTAATLEGMNKNLKKRRGKPKTEED